MIVVGILAADVRRVHLLRGSYDVPPAHRLNHFRKNCSNLLRVRVTVRVRVRVRVRIRITIRIRNRIRIRIRVGIRVRVNSSRYFRRHRCRWCCRLWFHSMSVNFHGGDLEKCQAPCLFPIRHFARVEKSANTVAKL